jgi:hypothetical protein
VCVVSAPRITGEETRGAQAAAKSCASSCSAHVRASQHEPPAAGYADPSAATPQQQPHDQRHRSPPPPHAPQPNIRPNEAMSPRPTERSPKTARLQGKVEWREADSNRRHHDFQAYRDTPQNAKRAHLQGFSACQHHANTVFSRWFTGGFGPRMGVVVQNLGGPVGEQSDQGLWLDSRSYTELYEV